MRLSQAFAATLLASTLGMTLSACEKEGPVEEAGEKVDETVEETGEAIEDNTDG